MLHYPRLAFIGSGPTTIYLLKHLQKELKRLQGTLREISIFEQDDAVGMGMPYNPRTTDRYNICNISSAEMPPMNQPFADWLRAQSDVFLLDVGVDPNHISDSQTYSRIALGQYFRSQYFAIVDQLRAEGVTITEHLGCKIVDVTDDPVNAVVTLIDSQGGSYQADRLVVATGHAWHDKDRPESGYYASPWPMHKLLPGENQLHNCTIGTLGASLSAFDVITSLAHRHGRFVGEEENLQFEPDPCADRFKLVMHSANGWLPHLQYEQEEAFRKIYRHVDRESLLALRDDAGFLHLKDFFDYICRPALITAFREDGRDDIVGLLNDPAQGLEQFVDQMTAEHGYDDAFEGMRSEIKVARRSLEQGRPIHWKEVLDDLMYTLNFHAELLPAEDHLRFRSVVMSFLMNVIAAMPLSSARILLALHNAGRLELARGYASIKEFGDGQTIVTVDKDGETSEHVYGLFIDCSGQKPLEVVDYPFQSLVRAGAARSARVAFSNRQAAKDVAEEDQELVFEENGQMLCRIGGIEIDGAYRVIGADARPNPRLIEMAFPHTSGMRPYSYGLQACSDTAAIVVENWVKEIEQHRTPPADPDSATRVYDEVSSA